MDDGFNMLVREILRGRRDELNKEKTEGVVNLSEGMSRLNNTSGGGDGYTGGDDGDGGSDESAWTDGCCVT